MQKVKIFTTLTIFLSLALIFLLFFFLYQSLYKETLTTKTNNNESTISYLKAAEQEGKEASVEGQIKYVFNNGKDLLLGFNDPHAGYFKIIIKKENWDNFGSNFGSEIGRNKESLYKEGDKVTANGKIQWYQGDPVIYVSNPSQIKIKNN